MRIATFDTATLPTAFASAVEAPADDGWVKLMPVGPLHHRDQGARWRLTDAAAVAAASTSRMGDTDVVIDYEHETDRDNGQPAPAAGWIKEFEARADGLWGRVEWTDRAKRMLAAREYRYISPTFLHDGTGEVRLIARAALTNAPALDLPALASTTIDQRSNGMHPKTVHKALGLAEDATDEDVTKAVVALGARHAATMSALGLPADADEAAAKAKLETMSTAAPAASDFVPRAEYDRVAGDVKALREAETERAATAAVDKATAAGKIAPGMRDWAMARAKADLEDFERFAEAAPALMSATGTGAVRTPAAADGGGVAKVLGVDPKGWEDSGKRLSGAA